MQRRESKTHPVLRLRGFVAEAGPLLEVAEIFTLKVERGEHCVLFYGIPRFGKSTALWYLVMKVLAENIPMLTVSMAVDLNGREPTTGMYFELLRSLHPTVSLDVRNVYVKLKAQILTECCNKDTDRVVIGIDEAQNFRVERLGQLKALVDDLINLGLSPFVVLFAQPDILDRLKTYRKKLGEGLIDRFFSHVHRYRGLRSGEFQAVMSHYDTARWPDPNGPTYTEYFAPKQWRKGFRLASCSAPFGQAFTGLATKLSRPPDDIGMKYVTTAVRVLLLTLQDAESKGRAPDDIDMLVANAVRASGYVEAFTALSSDAAGDKDAGSSSPESTKAGRSRA